jgi:hypothetical protein
VYRWLLIATLIGSPAVVAAQAPADTPPEDAEADEADEAEEQPEVEKESTSGGSDFIDTRLNFTFTNENVLADPDDVHVPNVPGFRFGRPNSLGTLFFDNYDTRFSGFETLSHAVLYKKHDKDEWEVEGALVMRINDIAEDDIRLSDAGSYIRVTRWMDPTRATPARWSLTAFPTSSDRFRLGYSYRLSWGGSPEYQRSDQAVPGVKVQWENDKLYGFVGAKSAVLLDRTVNEERAVQAYLAGAGVDVSDMLRVEVNGGVFDRGTNEQQDVLEEHVYLYGASVQVALQQGIPVGSSIDYRLYRNDREGIRTFVRKRDSYPGGLAWMVAGEATLLAQTLKDPERPGSTTTQYGAAGDINYRLKYNFTRVHVDLQYRDLAYILHSTPSLPSYVDFSEDYSIDPNFFGAVGVDQYFPETNITAGVVVGIEQPATLSSPKPVPGDTVSTGEAVYVVRGEGDITILPPGEDVKPQFAGKLTGRLDFADDYFATILDIYYSYDQNRTRLERAGPDDLLEYKFDDFSQLGFNLTLQAKF